LSDQEQEKVLPTRDLRIFQGILYGIGCGIGGSIFILLGTAIEVAGPGVLISLILGGVIVFLTALNYSELSTSLPISGGSYSLSKEGMGGFSAFITGFFLWVANMATCTFSALAFATTVIDIFIPPFLKSVTFNFVIPIAIVIILFTVVIVFKTPKIAMRTLLKLTIVLLAILFIFVIFGLLVAPITNIYYYNPGFLYTRTNLFGIIQMFSVLFICFTSITTNLAYLNSEYKNPARSIPRVNILTIFITLGIYLLITFVVLINGGNDPAGTGQSSVLLANIFGLIIGPIGFYLMGIGAIISTLIAMNAALGSSVSILHALARDNYVPKRIIKVNKKTGVPTLGLIVTTIIIIVFTLLIEINVVAEMTSFIYFFGLAAVNFAAVRLRYKRIELDRPFKAPFFPYLPISVGIICLVLAFSLPLNAVVLGIVVGLICLSYYFLIFADRPSITLTLAGVKFLAVIGLGVLIWIINNLGLVSSNIPGMNYIFTYVLMRFLIFFCVFAIGTVILDIFPLKEFVYFFTKRIDRDSVAINLGSAAIINLNEKKMKAIHYINIVIGIIQLIAAFFIFFIMALLIGFNTVSIESITIGNIIISQITSEYIFLTIMLLFGISLFFSGIVYLYRNRETRSLGL
jgi:amino acid transporter